MPLILFFLLVASAFAQPPDTLWVRNYSGLEANDIVMDEDGNLYLAGVYHPPYCTDDMYAFKIGADYELEWLTSLEDDWIAGASTICLAYNSVFLSGRGGSHNDGAGMVARLSLDGDSLWVHRYGGRRAYLGGIVPHNQGGIFVTGVTYEYAENGSSDGILICVDTEGNERWRRVYGGQGANCLYSLIRTPDNGMAMAGQTTSYGGAGQAYLVKTDSTGEQEWFGVYGDSLYSDITLEVALMPDGGYALAGYTNRGSVDMLVIRVSADGEEMWRRNYGTDRWGEELCDLLVLPEGDIIVLGETTRSPDDTVLMRLNLDGDVLWEGYYDVGSGAYCNAIALSENNGYYFVGRRFPAQMYLACTEPDPLYNGVELLNPAFPNSFAVQAPYPNPFNSSTTISFDLPRQENVRVTICDMNGREIDLLVNSNLSAGHHKIAWNANEMPAGVYFLNLTANGQSNTKKVMLVVQRMGSIKAGASDYFAKPVEISKLMSLLRVWLSK